MNLDNNQKNPELDDLINEADKQTLAKLTNLKARANQVKADRKFVSLFRDELSETVRSKSSTNKAIKQPLTFFSFMNKLIIPLVAVAVLASGTGYWFASKNDPALLGVGDNQLLSGKYAVTEVNENSFGDLNKVNIIDETQANSAKGAANGLAQANAPTASTSADAMGLGGGGTAIAPGEPYPCGDGCPESYKFKYVGKDLTGLPDTEAVLKRTKPVQPPTLIDRLLKMFSFGLVDLSKFQNARMQNVSFIEDRDYGLNVNVDLNVGSISMYQNWEKWPQYTYGCYGYSCGNMPQLEPKDIPSDEELINITNQFMSDYQISHEGFGDPVVYDYSNWKIMYDKASDKKSVYLPEQVNVIYPLQLEGQTVYDESGSPSGLNITVDVRSKRVSNVYGLDTKQFQKSNYKGETDASRILDVAERGGYRNYSYEYPGKVVTLELGTPTIQMVRMWYTTNPNQSGEEVYLPAYIFPINNADKTDYWRKNVIVPLVRDILDNENPQYPPMPMSDGAGGSFEGSPAVAPDTMSNSKN